MKCKLLFETKNVPTFEDFKKSIHQYEGCSIRMIIERACQTISYSFIKGYLLTPVNQCYRFEYCKETSRILTETIGELKPKVPLTFDTLRKANIARLPEFKNSKGLPAHSKEDGSDWSSAQWLQAVIGELGEYANVMKKVERGDLTFEEAKPSIEKELADVMTYLDILAFRLGVDLAKATENKFNEVSERVGCSLRIENNEVVRKPDINKTYGFVLPTYPQAVDFAKTGTIPKLTDEETQENSNRMEKYKSSAKQIANNWIGDNKISNLTRAKIEDLIEKDILDIKKSIESESGKVSDAELIANAVLLGVKFGETTKLKVDQLIKNDSEKFKAAKKACKIPRQELFLNKMLYSNVGDLMNQMVRFKLFKGYLNVYPLDIIREQITDIYSFDFQGPDDGKQYLFYSVKKLNYPIFNYRRSICKTWLFDFFSKQLGTKIVGMLINGRKENKILNSNDTVQFYDDRNVLYNFRLVKSSDENVEISAT